MSTSELGATHYSPVECWIGGGLESTAGIYDALLQKMIAYYDPDDARS